MAGVKEGAEVKTGAAPPLGSAKKGEFQKTRLRETPVATGLHVWVVKDLILLFFFLLCFYKTIFWGQLASLWWCYHTSTTSRVCVWLQPVVRCRESSVRTHTDREEKRRLRKVDVKNGCDNPATACEHVAVHAMTASKLIALNARDWKLKGESLCLPTEGPADLPCTQRHLTFLLPEPVTLKGITEYHWHSQMTSEEKSSLLLLPASSAISFEAAEPEAKLWSYQN